MLAPASLSTVAGAHGTAHASAGALPGPDPAGEPPAPTRRRPHRPPPAPGAAGAAGSGLAAAGGAARRPSPCLHRAVACACAGMRGRHGRRSIRGGPNGRASALPEPKLTPGPRPATVNHRRKSHEETSPHAGRSPAWPSGPGPDRRSPTSRWRVRPPRRSPATQQTSSSNATSTQIAPSNQNINVRVLSPGDNGSVTQSNESAAAVVRRQPQRDRAGRRPEPVWLRLERPPGGGAARRQRAEGRVGRQLDPGQAQEPEHLGSRAEPGRRRRRRAEQQLEGEVRGGQRQRDQPGRRSGAGQGQGQGHATTAAAVRIPPESRQRVRRPTTSRRPTPPPRPPRSSRRTRASRFAC